MSLTVFGNHRNKYSSTFKPAFLCPGLESIVEYFRQEWQTEANFYCQMCETKFQQANFIAHVTGYRHRYAFIVSFYFHLLQDSIEEKNCERSSDIFVSHEMTRNIKGGWILSGGAATGGLGGMCPPQNPDAPLGATKHVLFICVRKWWCPCKNLASICLKYAYIMIISLFLCICKWLHPPPPPSRKR